MKVPAIQTICCFKFTNYNKTLSAMSIISEQVFLSRFPASLSKITNVAESVSSITLTFIRYLQNQLTSLHRFYSYAYRYIFFFSKIYFINKVSYIKIEY